MGGRGDFPMTRSVSGRAPVSCGAARAGRTDAIAQLIAIGEDDRYGPLTRANAIGYLGTYADARATAAVVRAGTAVHPAVRTTAIAALRRTPRDNQASRAVILGG